jgi:hypothetical protein
VSALLSFLRADDARWQSCDNIVELASSASDVDSTVIGTSPYLGDRATTAVPVPVAPTLSQDNRYLFRLCGVEIPVGFGIVIRGLRQGATIRHVEQTNGEPLIIEREVVSPFWSFLDGNISWHLRLQQQQFAPRGFDPAQLAGTDPEMRSLDTALLYSPPLVPYTALGAGQPPGAAVGDLGTFRDMRYQWDQTQWGLSQMIRGPGAVVFYASVHQTDPANRPLYPGVAGMRPEDQFISNFPDAIYGRVAGGMIFELMPCCDEQRKKGKRR